jgi:predicted outer membrane repeat protein
MIFRSLLRKYIVISLTCILVVCCIDLFAAISYVTVTGSGAKNGSGWDNAFDMSQLGTAMNGAPGSEVWVAAGIYYPSTYPYEAGNISRDYAFALKDGVAVYGGFTGVEASREARNFIRNKTILSGDIGIKDNDSDNCYHVVLSSGNGNTAVLDGFTLQEGMADGSGLITAMGRDVYRSSGAGIFATHSSAIFRNCIIRSNTADTNGGGICFEYGAPVLQNSVVTGNIAPTGKGGGLFGYSSSYNLSNCVFALNVAGSYGGGIFQMHSVSSIINCTISENSAAGSGGGIYHDNAAGMIVNTIVYGNHGGGVPNLAASTYGPFVSYSSLGDGLTGTANDAGHNESSDPLFVNIADPDGADNVWMTGDDGLIISCNSSAKDAGTSSGAPNCDLTGTSRPQFSNVDAGAYESILSTRPPTVYVIASQNDICAGMPVIFTAITTNHGSNPEFVWKKNGNTVSTMGPGYYDNTLSNGDEITCILSSDATCVSVAGVLSNTLTMVVSPLEDPSNLLSTTTPNISTGDMATLGTYEANREPALLRRSARNVQIKSLVMTESKRGRR